MSENSGIPNTGEFEAFVHGYLLGISEQQGEGHASSSQIDNQISDIDLEEAFGAPSDPSAPLLAPHFGSFQPSQNTLSPWGLGTSMGDSLLVGSQQGTEILHDQDFPTLVNPFIQQCSQQDLCAQETSEYLPMTLDGFASMDTSGIDGLAVENADLLLLDEPCDLALSEAGDDDTSHGQRNCDEWEAAIRQPAYLPTQPQPPPPSPQEHPIPCGRDECHICQVFSLPF